MVLGGVATGSINANEAENTTGIIIRRGLISVDFDNAISIGNTKYVDAVLEEISVKNVINVHKIKTIKIG
jgi:hypothetical protein